MSDIPVIQNDRVELTSFIDGVAVFEVGGVDAYSDGIVDSALRFDGVTYIGAPTVMEFVGVRRASDPPQDLSEDGTVFEFYETDFQSDGGQVIVSEFGVVGGRRITSVIGIVVADSCISFDGSLPSGRQWRPARESS